MTAPTVALTFSPASPLTGQAFQVVATVTGYSTATGIKLRRASVMRLSGPNAVFSEFVLQGVPKFAGVNKPATADYLANAGSAATSVVTFNGVAPTAGVLAVDCEVVYTLDSDSSQVHMLAGSTNVTIQ